MDKLKVVATRELLHGRDVYAAGEELECSPADAQHYVERHLAAYRTRELSAAPAPSAAAASTASVRRPPPPAAARGARSPRTGTGTVAGPDAAASEPAAPQASAGTPVAPMGTITGQAIVPQAEPEDVGRSASEGDPQ